MLLRLNMEYTFVRSQQSLFANHVTDRSWSSSSSFIRFPMCIIMMGSVNTCNVPHPPLERLSYYMRKA